MNKSITLQQPLLSLFWSKKKNPVLYNITLIFISSFVLAFSAKITILTAPVPITLQTFAVLGIAMAFGWRIGCATVVLYLFEGLMGLPFFADIGLLSTTGGYLVGFLPAAFIAGYAVENGWGRYRFTTFLAAFFGTAVIYIYGVTWLASVTDFETAIYSGLLPFVWVDLAKMLALAAIIPVMWKNR